MKTPEEIKKGLERCQLDKELLFVDCSHCPYYMDTAHCDLVLHADALTYIQTLESSYSQVSKALCNKENATLEEVLQAVSQVKAELESVKRERDAIVELLRGACTLCKNNKLENEDDLCFRCKWGYALTSEDSWEFGGVCPENTEVQEDE